MKKPFAKYSSVLYYNRNIFSKMNRTSKDKIYSLFVIFIYIISFFGFSYSQSEVGDPCTSTTFSGTCKLLTNCSVVLKELVAGKAPEKNCGFANINDPIVCCPSDETVQQTTTTMSTITGRRVSTNRLAERMCTEYSKAVYQLQESPNSLGDKTFVNVSVCAIDSDELIVGGTTADPKEFPHMAAVGFDAGAEGIKWQCGGTLVSEKFILTAAHCTSSLDWGDVKKVRLGDLNLKVTEEFAKPQERNVAQIIKHPEYRRPSQYNDIALLQMDRPVTFDAFVRPACLPDDAYIPLVVTATGWGLTDWSNIKGSEKLLKVHLSIVPPENCNISYRNDGTKLKHGVLPDLQMCAGTLGKDTCQGDSGGPLSMYNEKHFCMYTVIGVTSIGKLCGTIIPGIYTRVYPYLSWLEKVIWG